MTERDIWFAIAISSTLIFCLRQFLSLGDTFDGELDVSPDSDVATDAFHFLSLQGVLAFLMGTGWSGLMFRYEYEWSLMPSVVMAFGCGTLLMALSALLLAMVSKLDTRPPASYQIEPGAVGKVYLSIPDQGMGKIQVNVGPRLSLVNAMSNGRYFEAGTSVRVMKVCSEDLVLVDEASQDPLLQ